MTCLQDRQSLAQHIGIANRAGARLYKACEIVGIDLRTLQRWKAADFTKSRAAVSVIAGPVFQ
jgi:putative transposase